MSESKPNVPATPVEEKKTISMTVKDRIVMPQLFPERSNLRDQIIAKDIDDKVKISQEEWKEFDLQLVPGGGVRWEEEKVREKEVEFTKAEINFLQEQVKRLDRENQISRDMIDFAQKVQKL